MFRRVLLVAVLVVSLPAVATAGATAPLAAASEQSLATTANGSSAAFAARDVDGVGVDGFDERGTSNARATADVGATADVDTTANVETTASASMAEQTIQRTIELYLTPEEPGEIRAVVTYDVPESLTSLEVSLGEESTVTAANGFERSGTSSWSWTQSTNAPTLELAVDANQTSSGRRTDVGVASALASDDGPIAGAGDGGSRARSQDEGLVFVDAGPWALAQVPRVGTSWRWRGDGEVTLAKSTTVVGDGATGGEMAYFGPVRTYEATGRGEHFRLVVPERATLNDSPTRILDSLTAASERLRVGSRNDEVFFVAAPEDVEWGIAGLQYGEDDAWVTASAPVASADNVWLHEYVHSRQAFETTDSGRWVTEASADYFAALLTFEQGEISYAAFQSQLERGQRDQYDDDVLAFPQTWSGGANYLKGTLAAGAIDLRIRQATNRTATYQTVFRTLNAEYAQDGQSQQVPSVSNDVVLDAVQSASSASVREYAASLTRTDRTAETWTEATHARYFGDLPAVFEYAIPEDGVVASGVYGNRTLGREAISLAAGETLAVDVRVANVGWEAGTYETTFRVNGEPVASRGGELGANASTTRTFRRTFTDPGSYRVAVGSETMAVEVVERPTPTVATVDAPATARAGEDVTFTVNVRNDAPVPGRVTIPIAVDGEVLSNETVVVPASSSVSRTFSVSFAESGEHAIRAGDVTATVRVDGDAGTGPEGDGGTTAPVDLPVPGFDAPAAVVALAVLGALAAAKGRRTDR